jgi:hypothetical protein
MLQSYARCIGLTFHWHQRGGQEPITSRYGFREFAGVRPVLAWTLIDPSSLLLPERRQSCRGQFACQSFMAKFRNAKRGETFPSQTVAAQWIAVDSRSCTDLCTDYAQPLGHGSCYRAD